MDLPRLMFINEECANLKLTVDVEEFTKNNNKKKKPEEEVLQAYVNAINQNEVRMIFLVINFFCG